MGRKGLDPSQDRWPDLLPRSMRWTINAEDGHGFVVETQFSVCISKTRKCLSALGIYRAVERSNGDMLTLRYNVWRCERFQLCSKICVCHGNRILLGV